MTTERAGRQYGDGMIFGDHGDGFVDLPSEEQAKRMGWSVACPVVLRLIDSRGAEQMAKRYGEILMWSSVVAGRLEDRGYGDIKDELIGSVVREAKEPMGDMRDEEWIPKELENTMFGPASPEGYALPRLITSFLGAHPERGDRDGVEERSNRAMQALELIDKAIDEVDASRDPEQDKRVDMLRGYKYDLTEFTVIVTDLLVREGNKYGIDAGEFFHQLLGTGKLKEDNCRVRYANIVDVMHDIAPDLYEKYTKLSPEEIKANHVAIARVDF